METDSAFAPRHTEAMEAERDPLLKSKDVERGRGNLPARICESFTKKSSPNFFTKKSSLRNLLPVF
jgi:hypothetical protein